MPSLFGVQGGARSTMPPPTVEGALPGMGEARSTMPEPVEQGMRVPGRTLSPTPRFPGQMMSAPSMKKGGKVPKEGLYHLHEGETVVPAESKGNSTTKNQREETRKEKDCPDNQCLAGSVGTIAQISGVNFRPASPNKHNANVIVRGKVLKHHEKPDIEEDCGY